MFGPDRLRACLPMIRRETHGERENLQLAAKWEIGFVHFVTIKKKTLFGSDDFKNLTELDVKRQKFTEHDLTINNDPKTNTIKSIKLDGDSLIWFGSESGVHIYNKQVKDSASAWLFINNKRGFNAEGDAVSVSDFLFEGDNVWFATDEFVTPQQPNFNIGGIYKFNRKLKWERIAKQDGLPGNGIYCLEKTGNKIWAAVYAFDKKNKKEYGKGFVIIDRVSGKIANIDLNQTEISSSLVQTFYFDGNEMWVGTDKGLYKFAINNPLAKWSGKKEAPKTNKKEIILLLKDLMVPKILSCSISSDRIHSITS
ncbi:MAG: hypothetical protein MZV64_20295 [Ignavibacteriales bacterium]|nr:hypothetical protein [Ignavibacteriales bacterium]